jgi:hypothetical protein
MSHNIHFATRDGEWSVQLGETAGPRSVRATCPKSVNLFLNRGKPVSPSGITSSFITQFRPKPRYSRQDWTLSSLSRRIPKGPTRGRLRVFFLHSSLSLELFLHNHAIEWYLTISFPLVESGLSTLNNRSDPGFLWSVSPTSGFLWTFHFTRENET